MPLDILLDFLPIPIGNLLIFMRWEPCLHTAFVDNHAVLATGEHLRIDFHDPPSSRVQVDFFSGIEYGDVTPMPRYLSSFDLTPIFAPDPGGVEQFEDGPVADAERIGDVGQVQHGLDFLRRQRLG
jgi:hypothetical protein